MFLLHFLCPDWTLWSGRGYISPPLAGERSDSVIPPPLGPGAGAAFLRSSTGDSTAGATAARKAQRKAQATRDTRSHHLMPRNTEGRDPGLPVPFRRACFRAQESSSKLIFLTFQMGWESLCLWPLWQLLCASPGLGVHVCSLSRVQLFETPWM